jgi:Zn-dependent peptidase ImmA (M78 family)
MALRTDSYYRQLVNDYLKQAGFVEPPVSLEAVAERLGVRIEAAPYPTWFTAAMVLDDDGLVIALNSARTDDTRRAALGHLLAHVLVTFDDPTEGYPRSERADHRIADLMSSEFLMPTYLVHEQARKWFNDYRYLANLFGVSENDMLEKMREMGLVKARGMLWDY